MAEEEDIVQRIRFEGESEITAMFQRVGSAGRAAFSDINLALSNLRKSFNNVRTIARVTHDSIERGTRVVAANQARLVRASSQLSQSFIDVGLTVRRVTLEFLDAFSPGTFMRGINAIRTGLGALQNAVSVVVSHGVDGFRALRVSLSRAFPPRTAAELRAIENEARRLGFALRGVGIAALMFARRITIIAASAGLGIAAFRSLARAATGAAAAARTTAREGTAEITRMRTQATTMDGIWRQAQQSRQELNREFGLGKISLEQYTESLQELDRQTQLNVRSQLAQSASMEAAARRQYDAMRKLREEEAFNQVADKVGTQAASAFMRLGSVIDQLVTRIQATLGPVLAELVTGIADAIQTNMPAIQSFLDELRAQLAPLAKDLVGTFKESMPDILDFIRGIAGGITIVVGILKTLVGMLDTVAGVINTVFGTNLTGALLAGQIAVLGFTGALGFVLPVMRAIYSAATLIFGAMRGFTLLIGGVKAFVAVFTGLSTVIGGIPLLIGLVVAAFIAWLAYSGKLSAAWDAIKKAGEVAVKTLSGLWNDFGGTIIEIFKKIKSAATELWNSLPQGLRNIFSGGGENTTPAAAAAPGFARGGSPGMVRGRGTSKSDSILARLSNGEFVQRAKAVRYYGSSFMHALNNLRIPRDAFSRLPGFFEGGLAGLNSAFAPGPQPVLKLAEGGPVGPRNVLNLSLDGQTFQGMLVPDDTFGKLRKHAVRKSISPRTPNWYRG